MIPPLISVMFLCPCGDESSDAVRNWQAESLLNATGVIAGLANDVVLVHDSLDDFIAYFI